jgi:hypothetical protein
MRARRVRCRNGTWKPRQNHQRFATNEALQVRPPTTMGRRHSGRFNLSGAWKVIDAIPILVFASLKEALDGQLAYTDAEIA